MSWIRVMRNSGLDPNWVEDATEPFEFEVPENKPWFMGCPPGDPTRCSGAKAILEQPGTVFVWMGAHIAVVGFMDGRYLRYQHNGIIPKANDENLQPPAGKYRLTPPRPSQRFGRPTRTGRRDGARPNSGRRVSLSTAALMRR
jgi:hypothetical protein